MPLPVKVRVGNTYDMVINNTIVSIRVEKISQNEEGALVVYFSKRSSSGGLFDTRDIAIMKAADFKQRILKGGYIEVDL